MSLQDQNSQQPNQDQAREDTMPPPTPARTASLISALNDIKRRIASALASSPTPNRPVRLIAVSKLKPASDVLALHAPPPSSLSGVDVQSPNHLHYGENYLQELLEKSKILPSGIRWHFIGALQTNKCVTLARDVRGLWAVESVDTEKKANGLEKGRKQLAEQTGEQSLEPLRVFVQVNTSGEESKSGVEPDQATDLCRHIQNKCEHLKLQGLMTIGAIARSQATTEETENEDFIRLREVRDRVVKDLGLKEGDIELSMGMSEDFESAVRCGSDEVRVGSTIFGARPPKGEANAKGAVEEGRS